MSHAIVLFLLALTENSLGCVVRGIPLDLEVLGFRNRSDCSMQQCCTQLLRFVVLTPEWGEHHSPPGKAGQPGLTAPITQRGEIEGVK